MSPTAMIIVGVIAVLVFGKRLPEVARTVGKGLAELQKGLQGIQNEITNAATGEGRPVAATTVYHHESDDVEEATAPKFEPPPGPPRPPIQPAQQT